MTYPKHSDNWNSWFYYKQDNSNKKTNEQMLLILETQKEILASLNLVIDFLRTGNMGGEEE